MLFKSLLSAMLAGTVFVPQLFAQSGLSYEFKTKVEIDGNEEPVVSSGRVKSQSDKMRMDMTTTLDEELGENKASILMLDNGKRIVMLNSQSKTYLELPSLDAISNMAGSMIKAEASNVQMDIKKIGAGPTLLGYATVHYRVTQSMDVTTSVMGATQKKREETTTDMYFAPELKDALSAALSRMQWGGGAASMYGKEYADKQKEMDAKVTTEGLPLKIAGVTKTTIDGKTETNKMNFELTKLSKEDIPASEFEIPSNYTKAELPKMPNLDLKKAMGDAMNEATAGAESVGDAAKSGVKEGAEETAKEAKDATKEAAKAKTKKAIRGLFGKP